MEGWAGRPSGIGGSTNGPRRQLKGDANVRGRRQEDRMERRLGLDETDDSPQSATVTTYDVNKLTDDIINLMDEEPLDLYPRLHDVTEMLRKSSTKYVL